MSDSALMLFMDATHFKQPQLRIQLAQIAYLLKFTNHNIFPKKFTPWHPSYLKSITEAHILTCLLPRQVSNGEALKVDRTDNFRQYTPIKKNKWSFGRSLSIQSLLSKLIHSILKADSHGSS